MSYSDPSDPGNGAHYHTGKKCVDCDRPAGTAWSPYWCHPCNVRRIDRINASLKALQERPGRPADDET